MIVHYVISGLYSGGAEHQLARTVKELDKKFFSVQVSSLYGKGEVGTLLENAGIQVNYLNPGVVPSKTGFVKGLWVTFKAYLKLRKMFKQRSVPDVVHSFLPHANIVARFAARGLNCRVVSSIRVKEIHYKWQVWLDKISSGLVDMYTTNSYVVRDFIEKTVGVHRDRIEVIYNGIAESKFNKSVDTDKLRQKLGISRDTKVVIMVANLRGQKDHMTLARAVKLLVEHSDDDLVCLLVGAGDKPELNKFIHENKLSNYVMFLGCRDDVPALLQMSDVAVLSTHYEGSPNAVIEAMTAGVPVVATRLPETSEVVEHMVDGVLVNPEDEDDLADAIEGLLLDEGVRKKIAEKAQVKAKSLFDIKQNVRRHKRLYREVLRWE